MALSTLSDIRASTADWLNRSDLSAQIEDFVNLASEEMQRKLTIPFLNKVQEYTVLAADVTNGYFTIPSKSLSVISVTDSKGRVLQPLTFESYRGYITGGGIASVYSSTDDKIYIGSNPSAGEVFTIQYQSGDSPNLENYQGVTDAIAMPEVLLMGALMFGCTYLKDDVRAQMFRAKFYDGIEDQNRKGTGGAGRSRITDHSISTNGGPLV